MSLTDCTFVRTVVEAQNPLIQSLFSLTNFNYCQSKGIQRPDWGAVKVEKLYGHNQIAAFKCIKFYFQCYKGFTMNILKKGSKTWNRRKFKKKEPNQFFSVGLQTALNKMCLARLIFHKLKEWLSNRLTCNDQM